MISFKSCKYTAGLISFDKQSPIKTDQCRPKELNICFGLKLNPTWREYNANDEFSILK